MYVKDVWLPILRFPYRVVAKITVICNSGTSIAVVTQEHRIASTVCSFRNTLTCGSVLEYSPLPSAASAPIPVIFRRLTTFLWRPLGVERCEENRKLFVNF